MTLPSSKTFIDNLITELSIQSAQQSEPQPQTSNRGHGNTTNNSNPLSTLPPKTQSKIKPIILTLHCLFPNDFLPALNILDRNLVHALSVETDTAAANTETAEAEAETEAEPADNHAIVADLSADTATNNTASHRNTCPDRDQGQSQHNGIFLVKSASTVPVQPPAQPSGPGPGQAQTQTQTPSAAGPSPSSGTEKSYEVRLQAWNCTCPGFTLSAFNKYNNNNNNDTTPFYGDGIPFQGLAETGTSPGRDMEMQMEMSTSYPFGGNLTLQSQDQGGNVPVPVCRHILACLLFVRCPFFGGGFWRGVSVEEMAGWCAGWGG